jgi:hypothetical protein
MDPCDFISEKMQIDVKKVLKDKLKEMDYLA